MTNNKIITVHPNISVKVKGTSSNKEDLISAIKMVEKMSAKELKKAVLYGLGLDAWQYPEDFAEWTD